MLHNLFKLLKSIYLDDGFYQISILLTCQYSPPKDFLSKILRKILKKRCDLWLVHQLYKQSYETILFFLFTILGLSDANLTSFNLG